LLNEETDRTYISRIESKGSEFLAARECLRLIGKTNRWNMILKGRKKKAVADPDKREDKRHALLSKRSIPRHGTGKGRTFDPDLVIA